MDCEKRVTSFSMYEWETEIGIKLCQESTRQSENTRSLLTTKDAHWNFILQQTKKKPQHLNNGNIQQRELQHAYVSKYYTILNHKTLLNDMGKCFPGLWNVYIHTWRNRETEPQLCYVGGKKLAGDTQNVKGVFLQSGIIGIFIFPPFLILNQTLNN